MKLEFKTEKLLLDANNISIKWVLLNEEISHLCYHQMDFAINGQTFDDIITGYEDTAKQAIWGEINKKFPNLYTL
jgi:hypothetical protein